MLRSTLLFIRFGLLISLACGGPRIVAEESDSATTSNGSSSTSSSGTNPDDTTGDTTDDIPDETEPWPDPYPVPAGPSVAALWHAEFPPIDSYRTRVDEVFVANSGHIVAVVSVCDKFDCDTALYRFDDEGQYLGVSGDSRWFIGACMTPTDSVFLVTLWINGGDRDQILPQLHRFGSDGVLQWSRALEDIAPTEEHRARVYGIACSLVDETAVIVGESNESTGFWLRTNSDGSRLEYVPDAADMGVGVRMTAVAPTTDGGTLVGGVTIPPDDQRVAFLARIDGDGSVQQRVRVPSASWVRSLEPVAGSIVALMRGQVGVNTPAPLRLSANGDDLSVVWSTFAGWEDDSLFFHMTSKLDGTTYLLVRPEPDRELSTIEVTPQGMARTISFLGDADVPRTPGAFALAHDVLVVAGSDEDGPWLAGYDIAQR